jgi:hypothetical protein
VTAEYLAATRTSYDAVASAYADQLSDELRRKPLDRALLTEPTAAQREAFSLLGAAIPLTLT